MGFLPHSCLLKLIEVAIDQGHKKCTIPVFVFLVLFLTFCCCCCWWWWWRSVDSSLFIAKNLSEISAHKYDFPQRCFCFM